MYCFDFFLQIKDLLLAGDPPSDGSNEDVDISKYDFFHLPFLCTYSIYFTAAMLVFVFYCQVILVTSTSDKNNILCKRKKSYLNCRINEFCL